MEPSTRTPEGVPNRCPVCGKGLQIEPSHPPGDAPCPHCGCLLWFDPNVPNGIEVRGRASKLFQAAKKQADLGKYEYATDLLSDCVSTDPGNFEYVQAFVDALQKKFGSSKKIGPITTFFRAREARKALKTAVSESEWDEAIRNGLTVLEVNPWDVPTLTMLATACGKIVDREGLPALVTYGDCELFYLKCAFDTFPRDKPDPEVCLQLAEALVKRERFMNGFGT
jgi:hypothetical protein